MGRSLRDDFTAPASHFFYLTMKIDHDLRQAIAAAYKAQEFKDGTQIRRDAAEKFLKDRPSLTKKLASLKKKKEVALEKFHAECKPHRDLVQSLGLEERSDGYSVGYGDEDKDRFVASGGTFETNPKWNFHKLMARLVAAEPDKRDAILKEYGINWK